LTTISQTVNCETQTITHSATLAYCSVSNKEEDDEEEKTNLTLMLIGYFQDFESMRIL
jgi:hypothetical protein